MSLVTNLQDFATRVATEVKALRTLINGNAPTLAGLNTTVKTNLVAAINEVNSKPSGGATINDAAIATNSVWSSSKTDSEIGTRVAALVTGAPTTLDTLDELANALGDDPNFATTITTALGNRVRFDAVQTLTGPQQTQALSNIGAAAASHTHAATAISDSTATGRAVLTATDATAARAAIGAGTSNLAIGTTSTTAKAGDYAPPTASTTVTGVTRLATTAEATTGTDTTIAITPAGLKTVGDTKAPISHTHTAANISDSSTVGRAVLTAVDAPTARTAIGAGTSNLVIGTTSTTAKAGDYSPPVATELVVGIVELATAAEATTGTDTTRAVHPAGLKAVADTKANVSHTHTATQISDSTAVGRSVLTALDAPTARSAIGAGTSNVAIGTTAGTAADAAAVGDTTTNFVTTFEAGLV